MTLLGFLGNMLPGYIEDDKEAKEILARELEPLNPNGFCKPSHNLALNFALMEPNLWRYSILPFGGAKRRYRKDLNGLLVHQSWSPVNIGGYLGRKDASGFMFLEASTARKIISAMEQAPTLQDTVLTEIAAIEAHFGISIPQAISDALVKEAPKVARRRWSASRTRVKDRLFPLDGGAPRDLMAFE